MADFNEQLLQSQDTEAIFDFCRRTVLHGTPYVFSGREAEYYSFKRRICGQFAVQHTDIFIVGSAKLGFSPAKKTEFSLDSDVDVALVSGILYREFANEIAAFEYEIRSSRVAIRDRQWNRYHKYLRYGAIGWMRPDLIPDLSRIGQLKQDWFAFFDSISFGRSEVGNYKVSAGLFRSYWHLERYNVESITRVREALSVGA